MRHVRIGRDVQVSNAMTFLASDRGHVEEAYPGDIIGLHNHGTIRIGDTFTQGEELKYTGIPNFAPELFRRAVLKDFFIVLINDEGRVRNGSAFFIS